MAEELAGLDPVRTVPPGGVAAVCADRAGPGCCTGMRWVMADTWARVAGIADAQALDVSLRR